MNNTKSLYFAPCLVLFLAAGCAETRHYDTVGQICIGNTDKARATQTAEDVLGRMHFAIDKADIERGLIRTKPLSGAQFFEFWRRDNIGAYNSLQANLHSIRRIVVLDISGNSQELCVNCSVNVRRLSLPEHEVSSSARAYEMFSKSTAAMQTLRPRPEQEERMTWVDLGNDNELATEILKQIEKRIGTESPSHACPRSYKAQEKENGI